MNTITDLDWRKNAAAATQSDQDIEKAFLDQAWMQVQNKATPLMKAQHRVGFEIVHKNDENTRMVGVFVFRVNKDYLFVPVFFINGSIKGTDLLYRANVKRFVPLNNEWCDYLVQLQTSDEGVGVPMKMRQQIRDQVNLLDIVEPPQMFRHTRKYASVGDESLIRTTIHEMLEKLATVASPETESILRKFILQHGGHEAIRKIANTAKHDYEFARALMLGSSPENYMPEIKPPTVKKASGPLIVVHSSVLRNPQVKKASAKPTAKDMCQGYMIEDHRKEAEINDVVYTDNCQEQNTVEAPGVYDVLLGDGSTSRALIGFEFDCSPCDAGCPQPVSFAESYDPARPGLNRLRLVVIDEGSRASENVCPRNDQWVFGKYVDKLDENPAFIELSAAEKGQGYRLYNTKTQGFTRPFYVKDIKEDPSGLKALEVVNWNTGDSCNKAMLINPDFEDYDPKDNVFGKSCKLVRVSFELQPKDQYSNGQRIKWNETLGLGNKHTLNAFIFENNFKSASVKMLPDGKFLVKSARTSNNWTQELSEPAAKIRLMLDCSIRESVAEELMKQAAETKDPAVNFFYRAIKSAHNLRFNDWPDFYDRMNDEFGVLEAPRSDYVLDVEEDKPKIEPHRVGDVWRQESESNETLDTMNPMQLYGMSQNKGIGSLFEHGVVGELVKTYDAIAIVQTYIPDFEQALDRLGRIMFLFYWKPEDFAQAYGNDDQTSLENKLVSNFKSMGELTLELLQKAKLQQNGTVSLM